MFRNAVSLLLTRPHTSILLAEPQQDVEAAFLLCPPDSHLGEDGMPLGWSFFPQLYWGRIHKKCIYSRCTMWCFDKWIHCEMTTIKPINISLTFVCVCVCVCMCVLTLQIYSLGKFQVYNTLLFTTTITMYIRFHSSYKLQMCILCQHLPTESNSLDFFSWSLKPPPLLRHQPLRKQKCMSPQFVPGQPCSGNASVRCAALQTTTHKSNLSGKQQKAFFPLLHLWVGGVWLLM